MKRDTSVGLPVLRGADRTRITPVLACAAAAAALVSSGAVVGTASNGSLVPVTGAVAFAFALALGAYGIRSRTLASPLTLLGIPLLLSLAAAMSVTTRIFSDWSTDTLLVAVLIVITPLMGVAAAILSTDGRMPGLERGTEAMPLAGRLVATCCALYLAGAAVLAEEFAHIGGPPLLSGNIDQARFSPVGSGLLQLVTDGLPLALLIATWGRVGRPASFSGLQRRLLEGIIGSAPLLIALGGGRITVIVPALTAFVVAARYIRPSTGRRLAIVLPLVLLTFSSALFLVRHRQNPTETSSQTVLYDSSSQSRSVLSSAYAALNISLGEQLRVVSELRTAHVTVPPFTTSVYFIHRFIPSAVNAGTIDAFYAGGWQASTYAGTLLLDFGLVPALLFGFALGAAAHLGYRRFARGRSITSIWIYAYLAGPIAVAFYDNIFLSYFYPIVDVAVLVCLSRFLIAPAFLSRPLASR